MAFLSLKLILLQPNLSEALSSLLDLRRLGLLSACTIYGVISAYFYPRLFEGQINVFSMRGAEFGSTPLQPSPANITQTFYFVMTLFGVLSFYLSARAPEMRRHLLNAILIGGAVAVLAGMLDMATAAVGLGAMLAPLRTASYSLLLEAEVFGAKRIVGLCSEASSYAGLCMAFATPIFFLRNAFRLPFTRNVVAPLTFAALVVMVALSTSSTGYVGLAVLGAVILMFGTWQSWKGRSSGWQSLALVYATGATIFAIVVVRADIWARATDMVDAMVFHKTMSDSYIERSSWNAMTYQAFLGTYGLGAGLGSARASSWIISVLGNIGAIGAALMLGFLGLMFLSRARPGHLEDEEIATGAKAAIVPMLVMAALSGTSVGFGLMMACMFGFIGAVSWGSARRQHSVRRRLRTPTPAVGRPQQPDLQS